MFYDTQNKVIVQFKIQHKHLKQNGVALKVKQDYKCGGTMMNA